MQLFFIRHGQSENNALWEQTGSSDSRSSDPELTKLGQIQATILANFIAQSVSNQESPPQNSLNINCFGITHIYTSLMVRAVSTATLLANALQLPLIGWMDIHEEGGIYRNDTAGNPVGLPGHDRGYFASYYPDLQLPDTLGDEGWWNRPFEEEADRVARARVVLNRLMDLHGDTQDHIALVSHGGFYNQLLRTILKIPENRDIDFEIKNAAISRIDFNNGEIQFVYLNRFDFLPPELIT
jgi:2,3-bisphosphoglycerate-dependent phosphoglycerate mutase